MRVYQISDECKDRDYTGCGKAWGAIVSDQVVALRYMGQASIDDWCKPAWIIAVERTATGLDASLLPTCRGSKDLAKLAEAAAACDDCPTPPHRDRYRPTELLSIARAAIIAAHGAIFASYREQCRAELAKIGALKSGMCSCYEFCADNETAACDECGETRQTNSYGLCSGCAEEIGLHDKKSR